MNPDAQSPGPHEINNNLINAVHHAIRFHPAVKAKANYGKILATLLGIQAEQHAAHIGGATAGVHPTLQPPASSGAGYAGGQGLAPADNVDPSGGYVAQNIDPLTAAVIAHGGLQNQNPALLHQGGFAPESGLIGAVLAARHVPLPHWA